MDEGGQASASGTAEQVRGPSRWDGRPPEPPRRPVRPVLLLVLVLAAVAALNVPGARWPASVSSLLDTATTSAQSLWSGLPTPPREPYVPPRGPLNPDEVKALTAKVKPVLVDVNVELGFRNATGAGTGIVLTDTGEVLTNNHVINGATKINVTYLGNGRRYPADVVGYDRTHDIAVLRMRGASKLRAAAIGNSDTARIGDPIAAIGNAGGDGGAPTTSAGTIAALDRSLIASDALTGTVERLRGLIEVAAKVEPGQSGGPLVNADGQVIGVDTAGSVTYKQEDESQRPTPGGRGFAVPINEAMGIVGQIRSGQASDSVHVGPTALLGVTVIRYSRPPQRGAGAGNAPVESGAAVVAVAFGSPAFQAGLVPNDRIVSFDATPVDSANTLTSLVGRRRPGDAVRLVWVDRDGQRKESTVRLVEGPPN